MKPFDSTSYTIAHRPLHAWVVAPEDLSAPHSGARVLAGCGHSCYISWVYGKEDNRASYGKGFHDGAEPGGAYSQGISLRLRRSFDRARRRPSDFDAPLEIVARVFCSSHAVYRGLSRRD